MVKVTIKIKGKATTDTYPRTLGLIFDDTLGGYNWSTTHPEYLVKDPTTGENLVIDPAGFTYEKDYDLTAGSHTLETAPSSPSGYDWDFEVFINGASQGKRSGINGASPYTLTFTVTPSLTEVLSPLMTMMMSVIMLVMMISLLTGMMKAFKPAA
jgi:hypothetical protein